MKSVLTFVKVAVLIDDLGSIRDQIREAKSKEEQVLTMLKELDLPLGTHVGTKYDLVIVERVTQDINAAKLYKMLKLKDFLKTVKVVKDKAKTFLLPDQIDKISEPPVITKVYTSKEK